MEGLGGEVPGEQTVPRAECWAATILLSRIHPNAVARIGIDAAYVVDGISKRSKLEKGKNGDLWSLFFAILDMRTAQIGIAKVTSHLEEIAFEAIEAQAAEICDIIGNAFADEAASIVAKMLRPTLAEIDEAKVISKTAFFICIRLAFTQARVWHLTNDSRRFEAPPEIEEADLSIGSVFQMTADEFAAKGHELIEATQGKLSGHWCQNCNTFHARKKINRWLTGNPCKRTASGIERKAAFEARHTTQVKVARRAQETYRIFDSDSDDDLLRQNDKDKETTFTIKAPTIADQQDAEERNEEESKGGGQFVKTSKIENKS